MSKKRELNIDNIELQHGPTKIIDLIQWILIEVLVIHSLFFVICFTFNICYSAVRALDKPVIYGFLLKLFMCIRQSRILKDNDNKMTNQNYAN